LGGAFSKEKKIRTSVSAPLPEGRKIFRKAFQWKILKIIMKKTYRVRAKR